MYICKNEMRRIQFNCVFYLSEQQKLEGNSKEAYNKSIDNQSNPIKFELKKIRMFKQQQKWKKLVKKVKSI